MQTRQRFILVILVVAAIVMLVGGTTTVFLYHVAVGQAEERLVETAKSRARIIESVARFDAEYSGNYPDGTEQATLSQIIDAHKNFRGFGDTGEFVLARRSGDHIVFLLSHRHFDLDNPKPVPLDSHLAEPMRQALLGRSGLLVGLDYRGETVLAAHEPVAELNLGLVAKIDLAEIRAPFVKAGLLTFGFALLTVIVGAGLLTWLFNYMTRALETNRQELRGQQRLLQTVFDTIPHALYVKDREGRFMIANHALAELHRLTPEDFVGVTGDELGIRTPAEQREFFKTDREVIETGKRVEIPEFVVTVPGGEEKIRRAVKLPLKDERGNVVGFVGVSEDITERKKSEEELRASQRLLQTVLETVPIGLCVKDREGRYILVNQAFAEYVGQEPASLLNKTSRDTGFGTEEEFTRVEASDRRVLEHGEQINIPEETFTFPDGEVRWRRIYKAPLRDDAGEIVGIVGVREDITERKKSEEELRRFKTTLDMTIDCVFMFDPRTLQFFYVNRGAAEHVGYTEQEMLNMTPLDIKPEFDEQTFREMHAPLLSGEMASHTFQTLHRAKDGTDIPVEVFLQYVAPQGEAPRFVAIVRDITERRKIEQQLREAQKFEAVGQLAGGIAHDFNNTLQIIINSAHIAKASLDDPERVSEFLASILRAGERTASLTRQLLAYSRKAVIQPRTVNLNELTANLMNLVGRVIGEEIELERRHDDDLHQVRVDPGMIEQAILNLCVNARDAMPNGGRLTIETKNFRAEQEFCDSHGWEQPGDYAMVSLQDNGIGMPPDILEHVFEPFFTTKGVGEGTGLGLATAYGIVRQHSGQMEVVSEPGVGSTFKIYLPQVDAKEESEEVSAVSEVTGGNETILVAEDEDEVLSILSRSLESKGYRVLAAMDGQEALSVFKENSDRIDLVILDMVMPALRGREVFEQIREFGSGVPILFSSGYSPDPEDTEFLTCNGLRLIQKPYSPNELFASVREVLDR